MTQIKNEHIIYAYAPIHEHGSVLIIGLTDIGWEHLKKEDGNFLNVQPPGHSSGSQFLNVQQVLVLRGQNRQEIRNMMTKMAEKAGVKIVEAH
jgi:hypothetical protein